MSSLFCLIVVLHVGHGKAHKTSKATRLSLPGPAHFAAILDHVPCTSSNHRVEKSENLRT